MENKVQIFNNSEFGELGIVLIDGKEYFHANQCAKALGYVVPKDAIVAHCKGAVKHRLLTKGGYQEVKLIPEGDLYRLIMRSRLPSAEKFESWVFNEILPSIRKNGMYFTPEALVESLRNPDGLIAMLGLLQEEQQKRKQLEVENAFLSVKANYYDKIMCSTENVPITKIAKDYGMSAVAFNKMLYEIGIQFPLGKTWILYQKYANKGYTQSRTFIISEDKTATHTYWTKKGCVFLYDLLLEHGIVPVAEQDWR